MTIMTTAFFVYIALGVAFNLLNYNKYSVL